MKRLIYVILIASVTLLSVVACKSSPTNVQNPTKKVVGDGKKGEAILYELDTSEDGIGAELGYAVMEVTEDKGLVINVLYYDTFKDGKYGFHIHEGTSLKPAYRDGEMRKAMFALGHYDPKKTGRHEGPLGNGDLGDLPVIEIKDGKVSNNPLIAPRIKSLNDIYGRTLIVHAHEDNYSDEPQTHGGGGPKIVGGIIQEYTGIDKKYEEQLKQQKEEPTDIETDIEPADSETTTE